MEIRLLNQDDLNFANSLVDLAGWNQLSADWLRLLSSEPGGCFLMEVDGSPAGTATTTSYGPDLGWIGMVLVHPDYRRRGIATALLNRCITYLIEEKAVGCVKLDATPDGLKVYEKLGFKTEYELSRWSGYTLDGNPKPEQDVVPEFDTKAFGADRRDYLNLLTEDSLAGVFSEHSYGLIREGRIARYLGPVVSCKPDEARKQVTGLLKSRKKATVFWDIPEENQSAVALAEELGFERKRRLIRMSLGPRNISDRPEMQWAIAAPETG